MALNASDSKNLEQLALKGITKSRYFITVTLVDRLAADDVAAVDCDDADRL